MRIVFVKIKNEVNFMFASNVLWIIFSVFLMCFVFVFYDQEAL